MDWKLPNIGKTITNNILPSSLSAYCSTYREIQSFCRSAVVSLFKEDILLGSQGTVNQTVNISFPKIVQHIEELRLC